MKITVFYSPFFSEIASDTVFSGRSLFGTTVFFGHLFTVVFCTTKGCILWQRSAAGKYILFLSFIIHLIPTAYYAPNPCWFSNVSNVPSSRSSSRAEANASGIPSAAAAVNRWTLKYRWLVVKSFRVSSCCKTRDAFPWSRTIAPEYPWDTSERTLATSWNTIVSAS